MPADELRNVHDLIAAHRAGRATCTADEAYPVVGVPRASFYRSMNRGEVPGVLRLGRKRLIALGPFLRWLGVDDDEAAGQALGVPPTGD